MTSFAPHVRGEAILRPVWRCDLGPLTRRMATATQRRRPFAAMLSAPLAAAKLVSYISRNAIVLINKRIYHANFSKPETRS
jgi:hypothetical protein